MIPDTVPCLEGKLLTCSSSFKEWNNILPRGNKKGTTIAQFGRIVE